MKRSKIILFLVIHLLVLFEFTAIQDQLLQWNFSWTLSKLSSYILLGLSGIGFGLSLWPRTQEVSKYLRLFFFLVNSTLGFSLGFWQYPIYQGDFNKEGKNIRHGKVNSDLQADFILVALPDCPYCHEAVKTLNTLQKRNPNMHLEIVVLTAFDKSLDRFKSEAVTSIKIKKAENIEQLVGLTGEKFPAFIQAKNAKPINIWSNDQLGTRALDYLENELE